MERRSIEWRAVLVFAKNSAIFRLKKLKFLNFFESCDIAHCLSELLRFFLQTHLEDPFAYFSAALATF